MTTIELLTETLQSLKFFKLAIKVMAIMKRISILTAVVITLFNLNGFAQESKGLEIDSSEWETKDDHLWTITDEKAASGELSLNYKVSAGSGISDSPLISIDTEHTILKVRTARSTDESYIVGSSFEGILLAIGYDGNIRWKNTLSGYMNHDLWCEDITGDGEDEIFAANANGTLYCLNAQGTILWSFKKNDAPMYSVCVVHKSSTPYVVCGGFDKNIYYLNADGSLKQTLPASSYSVNTVFSGVDAPSKTHIANLIRKVKKADGTELMAVLGTNNSMQVTGHIYIFDVLGGLTAPAVKINARKPSGEMRICDVDGDGNDEILLGSSSHVNDAMVVHVNPLNLSGEQTRMDITTKRGAVGAPGYRVSQPEIIRSGSTTQHIIFHGTNILLVPSSMDIASAEILKGSRSFNDMWKDTLTGKFIMASDQSGGSAIHIMDVSNPAWKNAYTSMKPLGKIKTILDNSAKLDSDIGSYTKPTWEPNPNPVYLMHPNSTGVETNLYNTPVFFPQPWMPNVQDPVTWSRDTMSNETYRDKRDKRRNYVLNEQEVLDMIIPKFGANGITYWGGHGNDPYFYSPQATEKVIAAAAGRQTILIYPEFHAEGDDLEYVLNDLFYRLASYGLDKNLKLFIRSKNIFWNGSVYQPGWSRMLSGEFASVFVPSMEETSDKTMEMSVSGRMGIWLSGAVDSWGSRAVQDNASYDRLRQNSDQSIDSHFLRQLVYAASNGATYFDNHHKPPLFEKLLASGVIYVPKRSEIVSLSPVHLSMLEPDEHFLHDGTEVKWLTKFDQAFEDNNPYVFSRMNGSWPGAPLTEWDFARYAAGTKERRLNFLPTYPNGLVLITPPQDGIYADEDAPRGKMVDKLHPIYRDIMKEYITDGRSYYSADGSQTFAADEYYTTIAGDIKESANLLPISVEGDVAWVAAQTSPTHLRLTLIDGGYINPDIRKATISFNTVSPLKMVDLLDGETFILTNPSEVVVEVPCGLFRFIDIELKDPLE